MHGSFAGFLIEFSLQERQMQL